MPVDDILPQHPAVSMAAAVGMPDPEQPGSERIKAFIMLPEEYRGRVTAEDIINFCRDKGALTLFPGRSNFATACR